MMTATTEKMEQLVHTMKAIDTLSALIKHYRDSKGPVAYVNFLVGIGDGRVSAQLDREIALEALIKQHDRLCEYVAKYGIKYEPAGDNKLYLE